MELVDTPDSKSGASKMACGFESHLRYKSKMAGWCRGSTSVFHSGERGSIPLPATMDMLIGGIGRHYW